MLKCFLKTNLESLGLNGGFWFGRWGLQAGSAEGEGFYFAVVALGRQFLAVKFEIQSAYVACLDDDFVSRTN